VLYLLEEVEFFLGEEFVEVRSTGDAVVVFTTDIATVFNSSIEEGLGHLLDHVAGTLLSEV